MRTSDLTSTKAGQLLELYVDSYNLNLVIYGEEYQGWPKSAQKAGAHHKLQIPLEYVTIRDDDTGVHYQVNYGAW